MNFNQKISLAAFASKLSRAALALTATALLVACGGGGSVAVDAPQSAVSVTNLRALPAEYLARKAVSYSPFRTGNRDTETPTALQVKQDLDLLVAGNFKLIRLFDSSDKVSKLTLDVIKDNNLDIKVHLGAYVNSYKYVYNPTVIASIKAANQAELDRLITLANSYKDIILAVSVGNETMVSWSPVPIDPEDMAAYISYVRPKVTQPVTTDDNFVFFAEIPKRISDLIDFASIHTYAEIDTKFPDSPYFWDWRQEGVPVVGGDKTARATAMMNAAMVATRAQYQMVRDSLDRKGLRNMPIVIGETGWNAEDVNNLRFRAGVVNQKMYFARLETWRAEGRVGPGPANVFYFEAFDEPWKGSDDKWGLFNVYRQARCVVQALSTSYLPEREGVNADGNIVSCDSTNANAYVAPTPTTAVTDAKLVLHSESVTGWPTGMRADAYEALTFTLDYPVTGDSANGDLAVNLAASNYIKLSAFAPKPYGWGLLWQSSATPAAAANMSNFSKGNIHFSIKTGYVGKLRIGISSDTELNGATESFVLVSNSDSYGYCSNAAPIWCNVSIPLSAFKAANPALDLRYVLTRFSISDVYSATGNADATGQPEIRLDNIYWSQQ